MRATCANRICLHQPIRASCLNARRAVRLNRNAVDLRILLGVIALRSTKGSLQPMPQIDRRTFLALSAATCAAGLIPEASAAHADGESGDRCALSLSEA